MAPPNGRVVAVHRSAEHEFSKQTCPSITVVPGLGVEGDAHMGALVTHRSRVARDPSQPNLRQVHLVAAELLDEVNAAGFDVSPGQIGENITTSGLDLIRLPVGTALRIGDALLILTGLRNPCVQLDAFQGGLQAAMLSRNDDGTLLRKAGVMSVVVHGGEIRAGDAITVSFPPGDSMPMQQI
jgi:MOSC domain-containing protein YiiM